jgi:ferric-chelate reductase [NAD(P)H]
MIDLLSLYKVQYGMYIVSTIHEGVMNAQISTVVAQITNDPIKIITCLAKTTYTHELIMKSKVFGVSILSELASMKLIGKFGYFCGRDIDKFAGINFIVKETGCPLVTECSLVVMEAKVTETVDVGTHTLFVGPLLSSIPLELAPEQRAPAMTYEYYHTILKGRSPENAPTYQKPVSKAAQE